MSTPGSLARALGAAVALATATLTASCGIMPAAPTAAADAGCPAGGWDAALLWSSQDARTSTVVFVRDGAVVGEQSLPHQGLEAAPGEVIARGDGHVWLAANGDAQRSRTELVRYDTAACTSAALAVDEPVIRAIVEVDGDVVTTNTRNGAAEVRRRTTAGAVVAEASFAELDLTHLVAHGEVVYALGRTMGRARDVGVLLTLDAATLAERDRVEWPDTVAFGGAVVQGDTLHLTGTLGQAGDAEVEGDALISVVPTTGQEARVALDAPAPSLLLDVAGDLYVTHTFMNPAFRPTRDYQTVSRVGADGAVSGVDVGEGLLTAAATPTALFVVTQVEQGPARLSTRTLPDLAEAATVALPPPEGPDHHYVAGVLTPPA
ncbi:hypothetical protein PCC79_01625 [Propioniciclava soli]|uniref:Uncharacterized protein n=1 Tax=Propioniciclava soli TaxID=2775081 RepID=A0ABZ3C8V1_9ACTN